ncbi:DUF169 domain-containing protein [candidate division KSB1 bacterium]
MNLELKEKFQEQWKRFFPGIGLPIVFWYSENTEGIEKAKTSSGWNCLIGELKKVCKGYAVAYDRRTVKCFGAKRYTGFSNQLFPDFRYFLSCGIPGTMEGERYKRTPEIVDETMAQYENFDAEGKHIIFKRWDQLLANDTPEVVIFFVRAEVLSGLFTLAKFDVADPDGGVMTPFAAGCGSIIHYPYMEINKKNPKAVIGMFDPSARPYVPVDNFTFALPMKRFEQLISYMDESFLITDSWEKVMKRFS